MTAKKKRTSPDPAPKKKTPAKGRAPSTPERVSPPAAAKTAKAASSKSSALDAAVRVLRESGQPMSCPAVLLWLRDHSGLTLGQGLDNKEGWLTNERGKAMLYAVAADAFREQQTVLHSFATFMQLSSIEGASLRAPEGEPDDRAVACALALWLGYATRATPQASPVTIRC